jgi:hypothetical protein
MGVSSWLYVWLKVEDPNAALGSVRVATACYYTAGYFLKYIKIIFFLFLKNIKVILK